MRRPEPYNKEFEQLKLKHSLIFPLAFLILIWAIKIFEWGLGLNFTQLGVFPLHVKGLLGIITSPLIHGDFQHLMANSVPFLVLSWGIFYFYRPLSYRIFILCYLTTNILVWVGAREAYHIGASGLVYSFASFLFFSGIFRNYYRLIAISFVVVFLYGGLFWGVFPILKDVSWEGHLFGAISGLTYALAYRNEGPQKPQVILPEDDDSIPEEIWNSEHLENKEEFRK
ncbi:rhomboid family intramembrane serine protease [Marinifilum breve]|uniref:Membrane associated rhomboid family serine protease n=2 Tax=Marinifilum TaxID=866673 RepID=A0A419X4J5_9BACT|nr:MULTISPECIES: rhomboid family intramembrane serine protease [Marinifilum]PXY01288.1 rhomboid family intramembrane serine protease [Marinifilum breve]RKE02627.1 membrane associated rhomboid family serine protease [Marinifilum flexuosum]